MLLDLNRTRFRVSSQIRRGRRATGLHGRLLGRPPRCSRRTSRCAPITSAWSPRLRRRNSLRSVRRGRTLPKSKLDGSTRMRGPLRLLRGDGRRRAGGVRAPSRSPGGVSRRSAGGPPPALLLRGGQAPHVGVEHLVLVGDGVEEEALDESTGDGPPRSSDPRDPSISRIMSSKDTLSWSRSVTSR